MSPQAWDDSVWASSQQNFIADSVIKCDGSVASLPQAITMTMINAQARRRILRLLSIVVVRLVLGFSWQFYSCLTFDSRWVWTRLCTKSICVCSMRSFLYDLVFACCGIWHLDEDCCALWASIFSMRDIEFCSTLSNVLVPRIIPDPILSLADDA